MTQRDLSALSAALLLAAAILFARAATWPVEHIDWDEWSFLLMGADVAEGHLPYVHQFDLKPPLVFAMMGAVIAAFGKSLVAVRAAGAALLFVAGLFTWLIARRIADGWGALACALLVVAVASTPIGLATNSELCALGFLVPAAFALARPRPTAPRAALAGLLVALAVMCRSNLVVVAAALGLLLLIVDLGGARRARRSLLSRPWIAYGTAGLVPPLAMVALYAADGELATLRLAMIDVPLAYSGQLGPFAVLVSHASQLYYTAAADPLVWGPLAVVCALGVPASLWLAVRGAGEKRWLVTLTWTLLVATGLSLLLGGAAYPHYWLQILPWLALLAAFAIAALAGHRPLRIALGLLAAVPALTVTGRALPETFTLALNPDATPHPHADAAAYLRAQSGTRPQIWALHSHLVQFYTGSPELSRAGVHPDNLARGAIIATLAREGYVSDDEIGRLMALRPRFVVTDAGGRGMAWLAAARPEAPRWLARSYQLDRRFGDVVIYRRR